MKTHFEKCLKYQSPYSRRDSSKYYLNINTIHDEHKKEHEIVDFKCESYGSFKDVFKTLEYKFKKPNIDTCKAVAVMVLELIGFKLDW